MILFLLLLELNSFFFFWEGIGTLGFGFRFTEKREWGLRLDGWMDG